jgi:predicted CoA-binding protein
MKKIFTAQDIEQFIDDKKFAFVGVSGDKKKFGYMLFRDLLKEGYELYPVNPRLDEIEGQMCYASIADVPDDVKKAFIITPKNVTAGIVEQAYQKGIKHVWMQQGASDETTVELAKSKGMSVIHDECLYMFAQPTGIHGFHRWINKVFNKLPQ